MTGSSGGNAIAVVGMACYLPGASSPEEFWELLRAGREAIRPVTEAELARAGVDAHEVARPDHVPVAAVLDGADTFDASFFRLSPNEARLMDPQHRKFLECSWEALEHAGVVPREDSAIGVFAGSGMNWYYLRNLAPNRDLVDHMGHFVLRHTANDKDFLATRVSYQFDLRGPSVNIQTACSTSLVAIHQACESLMSGECDVAIAGGSTIEVPLHAGYRYREGEVQSPDGHCRPFDAEAAGTVFGSGCGAVVLRRLDDAVRDGHTIHAQVIGSAINNDGARKVGFLAPSVDGHADVIEEALAVAGVAPDSVSMVEAHGTATRIGDPIEVSAFQRAFAGVDDVAACAIGSVKGNIGHLDTAAGVASFIKAVLSLSSGTITPSLHFRELNPEIQNGGAPFYVPTEPVEWTSPASRPRRAGVSSLGVGGTNAHVVLEEWRSGGREEPRPAAEDELFVWSARGEDAVRELVSRTADFLEENEKVQLGDMAHTLRHGREHFEMRVFAVAGDRTSLVRSLRDGPCAGRAVRPGRVAFLFPGQGAQFPGMAAEAYRNPVFRESFDRYADLVLRAGGPDIGVAINASLTGDATAADRLRQTRIAQPALLAVELALARALQSFGVRPDMMIGHSLGEYAAACISGVLTEEDALRAVVSRGALMQDMPEGAMAAVLVPESEVRGLIPDSLDIAGVNSAGATVVSGPVEEIRAMQARLESGGVGCRPLHTSHAFHSRSMEPAAAAFSAEMRSVPVGRPAIPYVSNLTGTWIGGEELESPGYWGDHMRNAVRFADGADALLARNPTVLVEVGPGDMLARLVAASRADGSDALPAVSPIPGPRAPDAGRRSLSVAVGELWQSGIEIDWSPLGRPGRRKVPLPRYPFQRQTLWVDPPAPGADASDGREEAQEPGLFVQEWRPGPLPIASLSPALRHVWVLDGGTPRWSEAGGALEAHGWKVSRPRAGAPPPGGEGTAAHAVVPSTWIEDFGYPDAVVFGLAYEPEELESDPDDCLRGSFDPLVRLLQGLQSAGRDTPVDVLVLTRDLLPVPGSGVRAPERLAMLGACRVVPVESPELRVRLVDSDVQASGAAICERVLGELSDPARRPVVAYRGFQRLVPAVSRLAVAQDTPEGGDAARPSAGDEARGRRVCLVTGAFGGVGRAVVRWLAERGASHVILAGRSAASHGPGSHRRRALLSELADLSVEASVEAVDVADGDAVDQLVARAVERHGGIDEVWHLAGVVDDRLFGQQSVEEMRAVLRPKILGTRAIDDALRRHAQSPAVVLFSSVSAHLGVAGQIAYAGANAFLDGWVHRTGSAPGPRYRVVDWGMWDEVGMGARLQRYAATARDLPLDVVGSLDHPLVHRWGTRNDGTRVFWGDVGAADHWILRDHHQRSGGAILPGTAFIDLLLAALREVHDAEAVTIENVTFLEPLRFEGAELRRVILTLSPIAEGWRAEVESVASEADRRLHVQAEVVLGGQASTGPPRTPAAYNDETSGPAEMGEWHPEEHPLLRFGPRWTSLDVESMHRQDSIVNVVRVADDFRGDVEGHPWHPALADVALGAGVAEMQPDEGSAWIPFSYDRLVVERSLGASIRAHLRVVERSEDSFVLNAELFEGDRRIGRIEGYRFRRIALGGSADETAGQGHERRERASVAGVPALAPRIALELLERFLELDGLPQVLALPAPLENLATIRPPGERDTQGVSESDEPGAPRPDLSSPYAEPETDIERAILGVWESQLGITGIGIDDDFFELGGHSLLLTRVLQRVRSTSGISIAMNVAFDQPTVRRWAASQTSGGGGEVANRIARVDRSQFRISTNDLGEIL